MGSSSQSAQKVPRLQGDDVVDGKNISEGGKSKIPFVLKKSLDLD